MVLRRLAVDNICWGDPHGGDHAWGCDVPAMAANYASGSVVFEYWDVGIDWLVLCYCDRAPYFLYHHRHLCEPWDLDIPQIVCGCWIRA